MLVGRCAPLDPAGPQGGAPRSGIAKAPVSGPVAIGPLGLAGDEQADRRRHGGPGKAVHHYALDHYAAWSRGLPGPPTVLARPGAFGENLSTRGLTESDVCVGDLWRAGRRAGWSAGPWRTGRPASTAGESISSKRTFDEQNGIAYQERR
ncbi:MOSC domain-containing protein [Methylobacterium sp. ID0610]|uniref:MOSC domain-containing protein n=1 Tax=Methylobacterium carpenticola TaxID=3344827 RepID=UPI003693BB11